MGDEGKTQILDIDPEIPLDQQSIRVLFLASNIAKTNGVCSYLNRRGWDCKVTKDVKKAIEIIPEMQPHFVAISINLGKAAHSLPKLLAEKFNSKCIVYVEQSNMAIFKQMQSLTGVEVWTNGLSGPSAHRNFIQLVKKNAAEKPGKIIITGGQADATDIISTGDQAAALEDTYVSSSPSAAYKTLLSISRKKNLDRLKGREQLIKFYHAIEDTLSETALPAADSFESIGTTDEIQCFSVTSREFSGHLAFSFSGPVADLKFIDQFQEKLTQASVFAGVEVWLGEPLGITVPEIEPYDFATKQALFNFGEVSGEEEIHLSFIEDPRIKGLNVGRLANKIKLAARSLMFQGVLPFPVYIFLKKNNRFYKVLNEGVPVDPERLVKLQKHEHSFVYIDEDRHSEYVEHRNRAFVQDKVMGFLEN